MPYLDVFSSQESVNQLWLKQYPVDSTLNQMTISVIRLWLDSYPWFSRPTQLWLDSFESESDSESNLTHDSWVEHNPGGECRWGRLSDVNGHQWMRRYWIWTPYCSRSRRVLKSQSPIEGLLGRAVETWEGGGGWEWVWRGGYEESGTPVDCGVANQWVCELGLNGGQMPYNWAIPRTPKSYSPEIGETETVS